MTFVPAPTPSCCPRWALVALLATFAWPMLVLAQGSAPSPETALVIEEGSTVARQVVAMRRNLVVGGTCQKGAAVLGGSAVVTGTIDGDLVVLGGRADLSEGARVAGDVYVLGGELTAAPGVAIGGRSVAYSTPLSTWILLIEGPTLGLASTSRFVLGAKLGLLAAWLLVGLLLFGVAKRALLTTSETVTCEVFPSFFTGLIFVLALVVTLVFLSAFASSVFGVPVLLVTGLAALAAKLWGTIAVFLATGRYVISRMSDKASFGLSGEPLFQILLGTTLLGAIKFLPWLGIWVWTIVTLIGVGAALRSRFGQDRDFADAWFASS